MRADHIIEKRVDKLLRDVGVTTEPIDVFDLAERLKVEVRPEIAPDDVSGGLYWLDRGAVIGVNASHHPHRQRFTVAHELGHFLLHKRRDFIDHGYVREDVAHRKPEFMRNQLSSEAIDSEEIEANRFAASLLMPRKFVQKRVRDLPLPIRSEMVDDLARQFKVSSQAMSYRLSNLDIPLDAV